MHDDTQALRIVVALARDTLDARADLCEAIDALNKLAVAENQPRAIEVAAWWVEDEAIGFFRESPHVLIEEIGRVHNPDVIIAVFWRRFGTASLGPGVDVEQDLEQAAQGWDKAGHPSVMLYFCENNPPNLTDAEKRDQREHIIKFRGSFKPGKFWRSYKNRSGFRRVPHKDELREVVHDYLLRLVRRDSSLGLDLRVEDWKYIDRLDLFKLRGELGEGLKLKVEDAISYFDGEEPKWKYTVSESIPRRGVVQEITNKISEAAHEKRLRVTLLLGPGGEGKSTILQQAAIDLTLNHSGIYVIWRQRSAAKLEESLIRQLRDAEGSFVIICDNAALIAHDVYEKVRELSGEPQVNIQFLLASQTIEWEWSKAPPDYKWATKLGNSNFDSIPINRLVPEDARRIVEKWEEVGPAGLGLLAEVPKDQRARRLLTLANEEGVNNLNEGSLLGAMLSARKNDAMLRGQVENLLARLESREALGDKTLQDAFVYIAAAHATTAAMRDRIAKSRQNGQRSFARPVLLSKPVLARALSCSLDQLDRDVLRPLADEKATSSSEYFVLVRHRRIAEAARRIIAEKFPSRFDARNNRGIMQELLRAARVTFLYPHAEIDEDEVDAWNNLPRFFFEDGQLELAASLAKVLVNVEPNDPLPVVSWAHLYREAADKLRDPGKKREAVAIFRNCFDTLWEHWKSRKGGPGTKAYLNKGYFSEWSVSEGQIDNHCYSTWVCAIALSDLFKERRPGDTPLMMLLSELTSSLKLLYEKASDPDNATFNNSLHANIFLRACTAAAQLGLDARARVDLRPNFNIEKARRNLKDGSELGAKHGLPPATESSVALEALLEGIRLAWDLRGNDSGDLPPTLPDVTELRFTRLFACFESAKELSSGNPISVKRPTPRQY